MIDLSLDLKLMQAPPHFGNTDEIVVRWSRANRIRAMHIWPASLHSQASGSVA